MNLAKKSLKKCFSFVLSVLIVFSLSFSPVSRLEAASIQPEYKSYVMAPLEKITDWNAFKNQLITLKNNGVYAITTDVWWGDVESRGDNQFDWSYYKTYADTVRASGLKWVPIISTHQCGGNVGDNVNIPIPAWLWSKDTADNTQFKDEAGNWDKETLSPWWSGTAQQYNELYASFATNFSSYKDIIAKIYLSGGPAGELRFPSYNSAFGWSYPSRGSLQAYTNVAKSDFRNAMKLKYTNITNLNSAWGTSLASFDSINPPSDGDNFFINGYKSKYGQDFLTWYQSVLTRHLSSMASLAHSNFDSTFGIRIGAKIAGIHWLMNSPSMPHAAEYSAGYYNYSTILDAFKSADLDLTFTCLEMDDSNAYTSPYYSAPKSLVINVANLATSKGIKHFGENALAISNNNQAYQNTAEMLYNYNFSGFTLLRLANLVNTNGSPTSEMDGFRNALSLKPVPVKITVNNANTSYGQNVFITGSGWELANWTTGVYPFPLTYTNGSWAGTVYLGEGRNYQFKAIKKDANSNIVWENGNNKSYTVPTGGGNLQVTGTW